MVEITITANDREQVRTSETVERKQRNNSSPTKNEREGKGSVVQSAYIKTLWV